LLGLDVPRVAVALICGATDAVAVRAFHDRESWVLNGDAGAVPWAEAAGTLLIAAQTEPSTSANPIALFVVDAERPDVVRTPRTSLGSPSMSHVHLAGVRVTESARYDGGAAATWPSVLASLDQATIVAAAELAGLARGALTAAIAYATQREQFGAPIATYQTLAHRLADMAIDTDSAELAVEEATADPTPQNASRAKIIANDVAYRVAARLHQINGGVGFYADQIPPAYYARALALRVEMGDSRVHRLRLAAPLA
jgi:alkylation response protein AidB-like acyl-CoA dehydrogenase